MGNPVEARGKIRNERERKNEIGSSFQMLRFFVTI